MIYLYNWKESSAFRKIQDAMKYFLLSKMKVFKNVFMLNDAVSARYLNSKFNTDKFKFLPDPFVPIPSEDVKDLREELNIKENKTVFLHFGGMSYSKGTLDILNAIELLTESDLEKICFIFAGRVYKDIEKEFYIQLKKEKERSQILFIEGFLDYSFLGSLCISSDFILIPYKRTSQSSGVVGYAAQFNKPVIAPKEKLLGKLVEKFSLGITVENLNSFTLATAIKKMSVKSNNTIYSNYLKTRNVDAFSSIILREIL